MSAAESSVDAEPNAPNLRFLGRSAGHTPDIPNRTGGSVDLGGDPRLRRREGKVLTIGSGISVTGEISACDTLVVEGTVEAKLTEGRNLDISSSGSFCGEAAVENAIIAGRFDGDLTVRNRLQVAASGRIVGTVRYGKLEIEAGGELNGDISISAAHG